jgi:hypothetical protein
MSPFIRDHYFDLNIYGEMVVADAERKKKAGYVPPYTYERMVIEMKQWLKGWLSLTMPKPSELEDLMSDAFLVVMKSKRQQLTLENFRDFIQGLQGDVMVEIAKEYKSLKQFYKTNIKTRK